MLAVRSKQLVKVMNEHLAIGTTGASFDDPGELYYSASFTATADAIDIDTADCPKALAALPALFATRKADVDEIPGMDAPSKKMLGYATGLEEKSTAKRIENICRTAGHYVLKAGKLHR